MKRFIEKPVQSLFSGTENLTIEDSPEMHEMLSQHNTQCIAP